MSPEKGESSCHSGAAQQVFSAQRDEARLQPLGLQHIKWESVPPGSLKDLIL